MIINKFNFPIYGIMILISIIVGILYVVYNIKDKLTKEHLFYFSILFLAFCFFGSLSLTRIIIHENGLSSYAGFISVILCAIIFEKILPNNNIYLKYSIISLPLIYAIGKIGCFLAGCCYGIEYNGIFSVTYTNGLNIPLFPIQIVETIVFMIIFIILNKLKNSNFIIELTLLTCSLSKFLLDFLRYDHMTKLITKNQIISIIIFIISILLIIRKQNLKK